MSYELQVRYNSRKSFYGKAKVEKEKNKLVLYSYGTRVAEIEDGKASVFGTYSATTLRHIREFLLQNGFKAGSSKQIMKDYGEPKTKIYSEETPKSKEFNIPVMEGERAFKISDRITIIARYWDARDGFNHFATLYVDGVEKETTKIHYINRTWELYEFQSVMKQLVDKTTALSDTEKEYARKWLEGDRTDWSYFKAVGMIAQLGEAFGKTEKEKNEWKARMLKAGLKSKGLEMPSDWGTLSEKEKKRRLDMVIQTLQEKGKK